MEKRVSSTLFPLLLFFLLSFLLLLEKVQSLLVLVLFSVLFVRREFVSQTSDREELTHKERGRRRRD